MYLLWLFSNCSQRHLFTCIPQCVYECPDICLQKNYACAYNLDWYVTVLTPHKLAINMHVQAPPKLVTGVPAQMQPRLSIWVHVLPPPKISKTFHYRRLPNLVYECWTDASKPVHYIARMEASNHPCKRTYTDVSPTRYKCSYINASQTASTGACIDASQSAYEFRYRRLPKRL